MEKVTNLWRKSSFYGRGKSKDPTTLTETLVLFHTSFDQLRRKPPRRQSRNKPFGQWSMIPSTPRTDLELSDRRRFWNKSSRSWPCSRTKFQTSTSRPPPRLWSTYLSTPRVIRETIQTPTSSDRVLTPIFHDPDWMFPRNPTRQTSGQRFPCLPVRRTTEGSHERSLSQSHSKFV